MSDKLGVTAFKQIPNRMLFLSIVTCILHASAPRANAQTRMNLPQFQTVLHTFVDDEMAFILDQTGKPMEEDVEKLLQERMSVIEFGSHRRTRHKKYKRRNGHNRGRFDSAPLDTIPLEVENAWNILLDHGWTQAEAQNDDNYDAFNDGKHLSSYANKAKAEAKGLHRTLESEKNLKKNSIDPLFLVCHSSTEALSGNTQTRETISTLSKLIDDNSTFFEIAHSSSENICIITAIQSSLAHNIAKNTTLDIVPWVDIMKISPDIFDCLVDYNTNFRQYGNTSDTKEDDDLWVEQKARSTHSIIFSVASTFSQDNDIAYSILKEVLYMANEGKRRKALVRRDIDGDGLTLLDAFSITRSFAASEKQSASAHFWSRMLLTGIESYHGCVYMNESIKMKSSAIKSTYEFDLANGGRESSACIISMIAGLAVHPSVVTVGLMTKHVEMDNANAQFIVQGGAKTDDGAWRRPYFDAGLDGSGQIVSVSDTGLDTKNCYFKDESGEGDIFESWDYSRRKVVRYDVNPNGGDTVDTSKGHGTHVVGTVAGLHVYDVGSRKSDDDTKDKIGLNWDSKAGVAPNSRIHFFDIGEGLFSYIPKADWFSSFYENSANGGAKIASASWGTSYMSTYDWTCRLYDQLLVDHSDILLVTSAGNNGGDSKHGSPFNTISAPASCKNTLSVGATLNAGFGLGSRYVASFSSRGPTSDNRMKPEVVAPGYALDSAKCGHSDCNTKEAQSLKSGTSMAAPVVAGAAALVRQYFVEGWYYCFLRVVLAD